ncbi:hypothetical protein SAMN05444157_0767 [Frankineae bacterium MT45]|nr:hypothetical protein SAMN05444157_0767 [Frankineae bacterium MT45]
MPKTLVDIPEATLALAQRNLGTTTKRETIERALEAVNATAAQLALLDSITDGAEFATFTPEFLATVRH